MKYDYIVLGGGLSGLAFAYRMSSQGKSVLVLEKEDKVGGLSRSIKYKDFEFDFCAHRFHSGNKELLAEVISLVPSFRKHIKKSRIYIFDKYLKYPFELQNLFRAMNPIKSVLASLSFSYNYLFRNLNKENKEVKTYKQWFSYYFGSELYKVMCYPYTSKIWKIDPVNLSADWADQRLQGVNIRQLINKTFKKLIRFDFSSYSLEDERLAPDGGIFYYGECGIQILPNSFEKEIIKNGSKVLTKVNIIKIKEKEIEVEYHLNGKLYKDSAKDNIITTIPLHSYYKFLDNKSEKIERILEDLKYMDIIFVYLILNKEKLSNDHWLYFADKDIIFNRSVEFKNWSRKMAPEDKTAICLDITCFEGDEIWRKSDGEIVEECVKSGGKANLFKRQSIADSKVVRIKYAYPFYDLDYKRKLREIVRFIEKSGKIFCLGRSALFKYNNADNSIEMGFELARNMLDGKDESLLDYKIKKISY